jgi:hypothetical protein
MFSGPFIANPRCTFAPTNLCAVGWVEKDQLVLTSFDPEHGRGRELGRVSVDPQKLPGWALSPDGKRVAVLEWASNTISLYELSTWERRIVRVDGWTTLMTLDWAPDSKGLFMSAVEPASILLHVNLDGKATVLWEPKGTYVAFALASPDGHHVAIQAQIGNSNAWMVQNF